MALAATAATLAGAGAGFWAVRRWMIDPDTGGVEPTVRGVRARRVSRAGDDTVTLLHAGRAVRSIPRGRRRGVVGGGVVPRVEKTRGDASKTTRRETIETRRILRFGFGTVRGGNRLGGFRIAEPSRSRRTTRGDEVGVGEATSTRGDRRLGPFGRFRPVGRFGPVGRRARTVASVRILTPGVVVLEDGVGLASSSSRVGAGDDGPGAEHAPAVLLGGARDEDATPVGSKSPSSANRARGSWSPPPFAARVSVPSTRRASRGSRGNAGGSRASRFAPPARATGSPRPPAGAAAASRGRFLTEVEFHELGRETTDRGLDELCGTPEFAKWMRRRAHKVRLEREDDDDDDA